jgi:pimeloyl-ACP methyl ester carboxylesterase
MMIAESNHRSEGRMYMRNAVVAIAALVSLFAQSPSSLAGVAIGRWAGTLGPAEDTRKFAIVLRDSAGTLSGDLDLPESGLIAEPLSDVHARGDSLGFVLVTDLGATPFAAVMRGDRLEGRATLGPNTFPFSLARKDEPSNSRMQPFSFKNGEVTLAGTLFTPSAYGPWPAVVFVHGSGAAPRLSTGDRARVEAYLQANFAVLVYDKRGVGASTGDYRRVGLSELADDALAGLECLRTHTNIISNSIGLHGRSQGCWIAEIAAARSSHVAFVVAEVGGGVPPWRQELHRNEAEMRARGESEASIAQALAFTRLHYGVARGDSAWSRYETEAVMARQASWADLRRPWTSFEQAKVSWERLVGFDPAPVLRSLKMPVMFALAENDRSTPTALTLEAIKAARAGRPTARLEHIVFEGADHAMLTYPPSGIPRLPKGYPAAIVQWVRFMLPGR